jgi:hypothetical protein
MTALRFLPGEALPPSASREPVTYLLYLDESGTHGGSPCLIVSGLAVHERDAWFLQSRLTETVRKNIPLGLDVNRFELHAAEIKSPQHGGRTASSWAQLDVQTRLTLMHEAYRAIKSYRPVDPTSPILLFGAVVEGPSRESRAYEEVLHKFDEMLNRRSRELGERQTGFVIHDKRAIERDVQRAAQTWREIAGRMGVLTHLADVPVFADSNASRLLQAADFVSWALWRYYGLSTSDDRWASNLWSMFDATDGVMHGLIHASRRFRTGCACPPCSSRRP